MKYSESDLQKAYEDWQNATRNEREDLWFKYCDIRDGLEIGTYQAEDSARVKKDFDQFIYN